MLVACFEKHDNKEITIPNPIFWTEQVKTDGFYLSIHFIILLVVKNMLGTRYMATIEVR